jgi:hypothetical protein
VDSVRLIGDLMLSCTRGNILLSLRTGNLCCSCLRSCRSVPRHARSTACCVLPSSACARFKSATAPTATYKENYEKIDAKELLEGMSKLHYLQALYYLPSAEGG